MLLTDLYSPPSPLSKPLSSLVRRDCTHAEQLSSILLSKTQNTVLPQTLKSPSSISQHTQVARTRKKLVSSNYFIETWRNSCMQLNLWLPALIKTSLKQRTVVYWNSLNACSLFLWGESKPQFSGNCTLIFFFFVKLIARNWLLRFPLHCCVTWELCTFINTWPASVDLMWAGKLSWYGDWLRTGRSGDRMQGGPDFPHPSRPALGPTQPPVQWVQGLSRG